MHDSRAVALVVCDDLVVTLTIVLFRPPRTRRSARSPATGASRSLRRARHRVTRRSIRASRAAAGSRRSRSGSRSRRVAAAIRRGHAARFTKLTVDSMAIDCAAVFATTWTDSIRRNRCRSRQSHGRAAPIALSGCDPCRDITFPTSVASDAAHGPAARSRLDSLADRRVLTDSSATPCPDTRVASIRGPRRSRCASRWLPDGRLHAEPRSKASRRGSRDRTARGSADRRALRRPGRTRTGRS